MNDMSGAPEGPRIEVTENAAKRVAWLIAQDGRDGLMLRVSVSGGGCSGFQYGFSFDDALGDEDRTFERDGVTVVVDEVSLDLLNGSQIDFVEDLIGASFQITKSEQAGRAVLDRGPARMTRAFEHSVNRTWSRSPPGTSTRSRRACPTCSTG
jgi:iron-sulfur cluster insertion protein